MLPTIKSALLVSALFLAPLTHASLFEFNRGPGNSGGGYTYSDIQGSYDDQSGVLTWAADNFVNPNGELNDGFWLVLNNGGNNPRHDDGLAIFFADFSSDGLWAFEYNGKSNPSQYTNDEYFGSFSGALINEGTKRGFSIDVSDIYEQLPTQQPFDENIGIWFHAAWGTTTTLTDNGRLNTWSYDAQRSFDRSDLTTTVVEVPEPSILLLFFIGFAGLLWARKQQL